MILSAESRPEDSCKLDGVGRMHAQLEVDSIVINWGAVVAASSWGTPPVACPCQHTASRLAVTSRCHADVVVRDSQVIGSVPTAHRCGHRTQRRVRSRGTVAAAHPQPGGRGTPPPHLRYSGTDQESTAQHTAPAQPCPLHAAGRSVKAAESTAVRHT